MGKKLSNGGLDNGRFSCLDSGDKGNGSGANSPQNQKKRKRKDVATESKSKRRSRLPVKKHRPKIFDAMKQTKLPKSKKKPKLEKKKKDTKKPKAEKKRKKPRKSKSAYADPQTPETPEPSPPDRISSSTGSCRSAISSQEHNGKASDSCSEYFKTSCKRALVYDDSDVGHGASPSQDFSDKIDVVPEYKVYTRKRKFFKKRDFDLNLKVEDFESCVELRKIMPQVNTLRSQLKDFPVASKRMRMRRRKGIVYPYFLDASKQQMLPTIKHFTAAILEPKHFRCMLALQPKVMSRKKRSMRPKEIEVARRRYSSQLDCALINPNFPKRKRSYVYVYKRRNALTVSSTDFLSNHNEIEIKKSAASIDLNALPFPVKEAGQCPEDQNMPQNIPTWEFLYTKYFFPEMQLGSLEKQDLTPLTETTSQLENNGLVDDLTKMLENLSINNMGKQIVLHNGSSHGALIPSKRRTRKEKPPDVIPDEDTMKIWMQLMEENGSHTTEEEYWEEQRQIFCGRVDLFIKCMHIIQGDRRFSRWKGSVVDSVVGVFLTQNVSDHLSSNAFMSLAAKFPIRPIKSDDTHNADEGIKFSQESVGSNTETEGPTIFEDNRQSCASKIQQSKNNQFIEEEENPILTTGDVTGFGGATLSSNALGKDEVFSGCTLKEEEVVSSEAKHGSNNSMKDGKKNGKEGIMPQSGKNPKGEEVEPEKKEETPINWDDLRKEFATMTRDNGDDTADSVDWEAVRRASVQKVAATIKKRGMNNVLAAKIKGFLDRLIRDHGSIDLEWLRNVPAEKTKEFLLSIRGIGLKSVECVRLLTLNQHAFPVDTNVGRIAVRLGWVPLQPLPDGVQLHLLEQYPVMNAIQKYLWPRLSALNQPTLYELHYQMITFGKVFCTKLKPKCNVCPMSGSCRHYASAFASSQLRLPGPQEKGIVNTRTAFTANQDPTRHGDAATLGVSFPDDIFLQPRHESQIYEPIVEIPASPFPSYWEAPDIEDLCLNENTEQEIDDLFWDLADRATLGFNANSEISVPKECTVSNAIVLAPEAESFPAPKLKSLGRLHTEHEVYELPDDHELLAGFRKREPDDPSPYLFAIWITDEMTNSVEEPNDLTVFGTILIPLRTANEARFPLAATYFQVNEVFADHETSENPIRVFRALLWNLPKRRVYCAVSGRSIFADMSLLDIHNCFWNGFICERGFDRKTREPQDLHPRFHSKVRNGKLKDNRVSEIKRIEKPQNDTGRKVKSKNIRKATKKS